MAVNVVLVPGNNMQLLCKAHSNLAQLYWRHGGQILHPDDRYYFSYWGLLIVNASTSDSGLYICDSVEKSIGRIHNMTVAVYQLWLPPVRTTPTTNTSTTAAVAPNSKNNKIDNHLAGQSVTVTILIWSVILLSLFCTFLTVLLIWKWRRGRFRIFEVAKSTDKHGKRQPDTCTHEKKSHWLQAVKPLNSIDKYLVKYSSGDGEHAPDSVDETEIWFCYSTHGPTYCNNICRYILIDELNTLHNDFFFQ